MDIKTCHPDKLKTDIRHTLYLLNGIEITEKIFNAINPVYIKSLKRISDKQELMQFGKRSLKNVVMVETFSYDDMIAPQMIMWTGNPKTLFFVNDIRLNEKSFQAIDKTALKKWYKWNNNDKEAAPYLREYPDTDYINAVIIE